MVWSGLVWSGWVLFDMCRKLTGSGLINNKAHKACQIQIFMLAGKEFGSGIEKKGIQAE